MQHTMHILLAHFDIQILHATTGSTDGENLVTIGEEGTLKFLDWAAGGCTVIFLNIPPTPFYLRRLFP
jgi:hypothetical protein